MSTIFVRFDLFCSLIPSVPRWSPLDLQPHPSSKKPHQVLALPNYQTLKTTKTSTKKFDKPLNPEWWWSILQKERPIKSKSFPMTWISMTSSLSEYRRISRAFDAIHRKMRTPLMKRKGKKLGQEMRGMSIREEALCLDGGSTRTFNPRNESLSMFRSAKTSMLKPEKRAFDPDLQQLPFQTPPSHFLSLLLSPLFN